MHFNQEDLRGNSVSLLITKTAGAKPLLTFRDEDDFWHFTGPKILWTHESLNINLQCIKDTCTHALTDMKMASLSTDPCLRAHKLSSLSKLEVKKLKRPLNDFLKGIVHPKMKIGMHIEDWRGREEIVEWSHYFCFLCTHISLHTIQSIVVAS